MFTELERINNRPAPFEFYTADALWTDEYVSERMLACHLDESIDLSSRNHAFIDRSAAWIVSRFGIGKSASVADFGCGPGLYTTRLAEAGAEVLGIDFSKRSIQYAKEIAQRKGLQIRYVCGNYLDFDTEASFDLVVMIMCDFCALSPAQRSLILKQFGNFLKPGGSVLLDVYSMAGFDQREEVVRYEKNLLDGFWSAEPYYGFLNTFKYDDEKVVLDKYTIIEEARTRTVYNWLQYFSRDSLAAEIESSGLAVSEFMGDVAGAPFDAESSEFAVIAVKSDLRNNQ